MRGNAGDLVGVLLGLAFLAFTLFVYYRLVGKTGFNPWWSLLMLVPLVNVGFILYLAFTDWPLETELRQLRRRGVGA